MPQTQTANCYQVWWWSRYPENWANDTSELECRHWTILESVLQTGVPDLNKDSGNTPINRIITQVVEEDFHHTTNLVIRDQGEDVGHIIPSTDVLMLRVQPAFNSMVIQELVMLHRLLLYPGNCVFLTPKPKLGWRVQVAGNPYSISSPTFGRNISWD